MEYKYFASYFYNTTDDESGFGQVTINMGSKISDEDKIKELTNHIKKLYGYKSVVMLSFQEL